jgi:phospholipid/cholesterol/gamma-HCH transport system substrate-binding protein
MPRTRSIAWAEVKLGVIGIVAMLLLTVLVVAIGGAGGFPWERYPLKTVFADAAGLKSGAVVRLNGKDVGTVTSVEFSGARLEIWFELSKEVRPFVTTESVVSVGSLSLLGETMLDVRAATAGTPLPDWAYVKSARPPASIADVAATATDTLAEARVLVSDLRAGRGTLGKLFTDEAVYQEMNGLVSAAGDVVDSIRRGRGTLGALTTDRAVYDGLKKSVDNLQAVTARIQSGQGALGRLLNDDALGQSIANTMSNVDQATARLQRGEGTLGKLMTDQQLYDRFNSMAARVDQLFAGIEAGQGTAGKLLKDQQLYENMNRAVVELQELFAQIRKDPKKYLTLRVSIF